MIQLQMSKQSLQLPLNMCFECFQFSIVIEVKLFKHILDQCQLSNFQIHCLKQMQHVPEFLQQDRLISQSKAK